MSRLRPPVVGARGMRVWLPFLAAVCAVVACVLAAQPDVGDARAAASSVPIARAPGADTNATAVATAPEDRSGAEELRDPFWPPDYVPPLPGGAKSVGRDLAVRMSDAEWLAAEKQLVIRGASRLPLRDGTSELCALINGESVRVGGECGVTWNGKTFRWRVRSISLKTGPVLDRAVPVPGGREKAP